MKVAIVIDQIGGGGGEICVGKFKESLLERGHEVEILSGDEEMATKRIPFPARGGLLNSFLRLFGIFWASGYLKSEISKMNPDLILILTPVGAISTMISLPDRFQNKTVYSPRYLALEHWDFIGDRFTGTFNKIIEKYALNFSYGEVFALSKNMKVRIGGAGSESPIEIVPIGVDVERFVSSKGKPDETVFLYVGRFKPEKGYDLFVEASRRLEGAKFLMVGDDREKIKDTPPNLEVRGKVPHSEIVKVYNEATALVLPSYTEGLPRTCLESLACGTPVIASDVGGVPDLVIEGETGYLVEPGNLDQLLEKMKLMMEDPEKAEEMGRNGREHVVENFDEEKIMEETMEELERVAEGD